MRACRAGCASLLKHAQAIHVQFEDEAGDLQLGWRLVRNGHDRAGTAWLRRHLPQAVALATSRNPSIKVGVEGGYDDALMRMLKQGDIDMAPIYAANCRPDLRRVCHYRGDCAGGERANFPVHLPQLPDQRKKRGLRSIKIGRYLALNWTTHALRIVAWLDRNRRAPSSIARFGHSSRRRLPIHG